MFAKLVPMMPRHFAMMRELGLVAKRYIAVMDAATCSTCRAMHGRVYAMEDTSVVVPNPDCTCPRGCDCVWQYLTADEAEASRSSISHRRDDG